MKLKGNSRIWKERESDYGQLTLRGREDRISGIFKFGASSPAYFSAQSFGGHAAATFSKDRIDKKPFAGWLQNVFDLNLDEL